MSNRPRFTATLIAALIWITMFAATAMSKDFIVAADGSGSFSTVQSAVDAVPVSSKERVVITIKPGTYKERVRVPKDKPLVTFRGSDPDATKTVLTWHNSSKTIENGKEIGTSGSYSTLVEADDFIAENITFENTAGDVGQAVAFRTTGDRQIFRNCRFLGWQDTLYVHHGRQYFVDCYVEGRTDFIFGRSAVVFDRCTIHSKNGGWVTASASPPEQKFGLVFLDCKLTGTGAPAYLGRPWKVGAATAFIRCEMGDHLRTEGWSIWKGNENHTTARYSEYKNTGPGFQPDKRPDWTRQLTEEEAKQYTVQNVLGGEDHWTP